MDYCSKSSCNPSSPFDCLLFGTFFSLSCYSSSFYSVQDSKLSDHIVLNCNFFKTDLDDTLYSSKLGIAEALRKNIDGTCHFSINHIIKIKIKKMIDFF
jgi:putative hydrolase of the HAD superfamily